LLAERRVAISKPQVPLNRPEDSVAPATIDIWMTCRMEGDAARAHNRTYLNNQLDPVVIAAIHAASLWRDHEAVPQLLRYLTQGKPHVRRAAAEALGRIGDDRAVEPLLKELAYQTNDRVLDHAFTYALIQLDNREYLKNSLNHVNLRVRRACLIALDQLGEKQDPKVVLAAMTSEDAALKETALWIAARHLEWAQHMAKIASERYGLEMVPVLTKFARSPAVEKVLLETLSAKRPPENHYGMVYAMHVLAGAGGKEMPRSWADAIGNALRFIGPDGDISGAAFAALRAIPPKPGSTALENELRKIYSHTEFTDEFRLDAMSVFPGGISEFTPEEFKLVIDSLDQERPSKVRANATEVVSKAKLQKNEIEALVTGLPKVSPLDIDRVLTAFAQTKDEAIGLKLVAALNAPELRPALRADGVKERIKHFPPAVQKEAEKLYAVLNADYEQQKAQLDEIARNLKPGDVRRGQAVFNSSKTSCIACHTVGYVGGKQGPDLTKIGGIRSERDLLESILFPSASFVRSYEPLIVRTRDGKSYNGVPKKDAPDEIVLVLAADKEVRIPRDEVEDVQPGKVSIMPAGLDKQLTPQELADLIAFLKACK